MNAMRFGTPAALLLLVFLPVAAALARRRVSSRGALALRLLVLVLLVSALASPVLSTRGGDLSVVFAVDRSDSIPADRFAAAQEFVRSAAARRRPGDRVGLVTFGATAITEELPNPQPRLAFATQPARRHGPRPGDPRIAGRTAPGGSQADRPSDRRERQPRWRSR